MAIMSGDTPTVEHSLGCPGCGSEVFIRDTAAWYTDEEEHCAGCGSRVMVALDENDADPDLLTARVYIYEHGGDVVARLLEKIEHLQTRPAQGVSDHLRARVAEACQSHIDGDGGGCVAKGCIPGHQAGDLLDAYDDARADHSQEVLGLLSNAEAVKVQHEARVDRLDREVGTHRSTIGDLETRVLAAELASAFHEQTIEKLRRDLCQAWGRDGCGQRFPSQAARDRSARVVAKRQGWDCYPEDSTTDEPEPCPGCGSTSPWSTCSRCATVGPGGDQ